MIKYRTFDECMLEELADPEEAQEFLKVAIEEYMQDKDLATFMHILRLITEAQGGIAKLAERSHISRPNLYKVLSGKTTPRFDTALAIINGLGYDFTIDVSQKIDRRAAA